MIENSNGVSVWVQTNMNGSSVLQLVPNVGQVLRLQRGAQR